MLLTGSYVEIQYLVSDVSHEGWRLNHEDCTFNNGFIFKRACYLIAFLSDLGYFWIWGPILEKISLWLYLVASPLCSALLSCLAHLIWTAVFHALLPWCHVSLCDEPNMGQGHWSWALAHLSFARITSVMHLSQHQKIWLKRRSLYNDLKLEPNNCLPTGPLDFHGCCYNST